MQIRKAIVFLYATLLCAFAGAAAYAQTAAAESANAITDVGLRYLAAALAIGIGAFGGALGMGRMLSACLEGMARNPGASNKLFTSMIIGVAFIESVVIYALIISFMALP